MKKRRGQGCFLIPEIRLVIIDTLAVCTTGAYLESTRQVRGHRRRNRVVGQNTHLTLVSHCKSRVIVFTNALGHDEKERIMITFLTLSQNLKSTAHFIFVKMEMRIQ